MRPVVRNDGGATSGRIGVCPDAWEAAGAGISWLKQGRSGWTPSGGWPEARNLFTPRSSPWAKAVRLVERAAVVPWGVLSDGAGGPAGVPLKGVLPRDWRVRHALLSWVAWRLALRLRREDHCQVHPSLRRLDW